MATVPSIKQLSTETWALDDTASGLLQTACEIEERLVAAKELRRQKSALFSNVEKDMIDTALITTARRLNQMHQVVKPIGQDSPPINAPAMRYVLRDSPAVQSFLAQIGFCSTQLENTVTILFSRTTGSLENMMRPPPSYEESLFLRTSRTRNLARRASEAASMRSQDSEGLIPLSTLEPEDRRVYEQYTTRSASTASFPSGLDSAVPPCSELDAGFVPYRPGHHNHDMHSPRRGRDLHPDKPLQDPPKTFERFSFDARPDASTGGVVVGRARSRRWLESQASRPKG